MSNLNNTQWWVMPCFGFKKKAIGQNPPFSFHHLTVEDGLNDGHIQMVGQDKFGYIVFRIASDFQSYENYDKQLMTFDPKTGEYATMKTIW